MTAVEVEMDLADFEQWVYNSAELEQVLSDDAYLELISFDYKKSGARYELINLLRTYVTNAEYETSRLIALLCKAKLRNLELPGVLQQFYDLYCDGYDFLDTLGLGFGLTML